MYLKFADPTTKYAINLFNLSKHKSNSQNTKMQIQKTPFACGSLRSCYAPLLHQTQGAGGRRKGLASPAPFSTSHRSLAFAAHTTPTKVSKHNPEKNRNTYESKLNQKLK